MIFADGRQIWKRSAARLRKQAEKFECISRVEVYDLQRLEKDIPEFYKLHRDFIKRNQRGFGYWLWKPEIVARELDLLKDGESQILYADVGCTLNLSKSAKSRFANYVELTALHGNLFFRLQGENSREAWIKKEVLDALAIPQSSLSRNLIAATAFMLSDSESNKKLLRNWGHLCIQDEYRLLVDSSSSNGESQKFQEHRHDQSLLSLLEETETMFVLDDETYVDGLWNGKEVDFPIWATRLRSGFSSVSQSFIWKAIRKFERLVFSQESRDI